VATTFKQEWERLQRTGAIHTSPLFASTYAYPPRAKTPKKQATQTPTCYYHPPQAPVWSEYAGQSSKRGYQYSPALAQQQHKSAMAVFANAERTLNKFRE
jgi:hypothetical protein